MLQILVLWLLQFYSIYSVISSVSLAASADLLLLLHLHYRCCWSYEYIYVCPSFFRCYRATYAIPIATAATLVICHACFGYECCIYSLWCCYYTAVAVLYADLSWAEGAAPTGFAAAAVASTIDVVFSLIASAACDLATVLLQLHCYWCCSCFQSLVYRFLLPHCMLLSLFVCFRSYHCITVSVSAIWHFRRSVTTVYFMLCFIFPLLY